MWAAHLGAVLSHATVPAITCLNLFTSSLLTPNSDIQLVDGFHRVPDLPGLGIEVDEAAVLRFAMSNDSAAAFTSFAADRVMMSAVSPVDGSRIHFAQTEPKAKGVVAARSWYAGGHGPAYTAGIRLEEWADDGSERWQSIYEQAVKEPVREEAVAARL